jgi:hypothetical protein
MASPTKRLDQLAPKGLRGGLSARRSELIEPGGSGKAGVPIETYAKAVQNGQVDPQAKIRWQIEYAGPAVGESGGGPRDELGGKVIDAVPSISDVRRGVPALGYGVVHHEFNMKAKDTLKLFEVLRQYPGRVKQIHMIDGPVPQKLEGSKGPPPEDSGGYEGGDNTGGGGGGPSAPAQGVPVKGIAPGGLNLVNPRSFSVRNAFPPGSRVTISAPNRKITTHTVRSVEESPGNVIIRLNPPNTDPARAALQSGPLRLYPAQNRGSGNQDGNQDDDGQIVAGISNRNLALGGLAAGSVVVLLAANL